MGIGRAKRPNVMAKREVITDLPAEVVSFAIAGNKVGAIKALRIQEHIGLYEAKRRVEKYLGY